VRAGFLDIVAQEGFASDDGEGDGPRVVAPGDGREFAANGVGSKLAGRRRVVLHAVAAAMPAGQVAAKRAFPKQVGEPVLRARLFLGGDECGQRVGISLMAYRRRCVGAGLGHMKLLFSALHRTLKERFSRRN